MEKIFNESREFKILFKKSQNLLMGKYNSKFKGEGLEFIDLREYVPGDDVRKIDWNVSARESVPFIKEYIENRDTTHYVILDISASMFNKIDKCKILASSLLLSSHKTQDSISIIFFNDKVISKLKPSKSKKHLMRLIYDISKSNISAKGNFLSLVNYLLVNIKRKSIISIISDEYELDEEVLSKLAILSRKNKLLYFQAYNSSEKDIQSGLEVFEDSEDGNEIIYDMDEKEISNFSYKYDLVLEKFRNSLKMNGVKVFPLDSKLDLLLSLKKDYEVL